MKEDSYALVSIRKSSSKDGQIGYDVEAKAMFGITDAEMKELMSIALKNAKEGFRGA